MYASDLILDPAAVASLGPNDVQVDEFNFEGSISSAGAVTQPAGIRFPSTDYFALMGVQGYIEEPGLAVVNHINIRWNVTRQNKRNVYSQDQNFSRLVNILGTGGPIWYPRGLYRFDPGEDIGVEFSVRTGYTWNGGAKRIGLTLSCLAVSEQMVKEIQRNPAPLFPK